MNKAERIRELWEKLPDTRDRTRIIADRVGCGTSYVRVVARQRVDSGTSANDRRYILGRFGNFQAYYRYNNEGSKEYRAAYYAKRYRDDPDYRKRKNEASARSHRRRYWARKAEQQSMSK